MGDQKVTPSFHLPPLKFSMIEEGIPPDRYINSDIYRLEEPKPFSNFQIFWQPSAFFWKPQTLRTTLDIIHIPFKPDGIKILFFERYLDAEPKFTEAESPCDPLLGCAKTLPLLRVTF